MKCPTCGREKTGDKCECWACDNCGVVFIAVKRKCKIDDKFVCLSCFEDLELRKKSDEPRIGHR